MKKTKEIVLYDDTENYKKFDETRDFLFAVYADENGWACKENIPDETVYKEIDFQNQETWRDLKDALENSFKTRYYLMTGTCGRWNGTVCRYGKNCSGHTRNSGFLCRRSLEFPAN